MWTKLKFDIPQQGEAGAIRQELAGTIAIVGGDQKAPIEIVADYLSQVKDHLIKNLDNQYGTKLWRTLPVTPVVAVPVVWSDRAKHKTLEAVFKGGFNNTCFPLLRPRSQKLLQSTRSNRSVTPPKTPSSRLEMCL